VSPALAAAMLPRFVYVASAADNRDAAASLARDLRARGHLVTSTWHDLTPWDRALDSARPVTEQQASAATCLREVQQSGAVVAIGDPRMRGGLWEAGYAMGLGVRVVWIGDTSVSVFATLVELVG